MARHLKASKEHLLKAQQRKLDIFSAVTINV